ncbi:MAG TPA: hypothetical protein VKR22_04955 [Acidimicrobiales bacterium]|nr:hypothetical protein [Acidimicrobiales bacterium]
MSSRLATAQEVETWRRDGWVVLHGLIGTDEIDAVAEDLHLLFPTNEEYHADPEGELERRRGRPLEPKEAYEWPAEGPGFRSPQQRWAGVFPFAGSGVLNRLCVHPSLVDFAERALGSTDIRLYQAQASAKYGGLTNYEQPMHTDRNHSWLPAVGEPPWWNLTGFLYLTDVTEQENPTLLVTVPDSAGVDSPYPVILPKMDPSIYAAERPAPGVRGSYLAYRSNVWHRGNTFGATDTARITLALAFKHGGQEWIGYDTQQSRSTSPEWTGFVEQSSLRELALFGFPQPGHPIWTEALLDETAKRYPKLDLTPWRAAL